MERLKNLKNIALASFALSITGACSRPAITEEDIRAACRPALADPFALHGFYVTDVFVSDPDINPNVLSSRQQNLMLETRDGQKTFLTHNPKVNDTQPRLSPDGKKVVFSREPQEITLADQSKEKKFSGEEGIYVLDLETGNEQRLMASSAFIKNSWLEWSPDGQKIIFIQNDDSKPPRFSDIYKMNPDGTELENLTNLEQQFIAAQKRWEVNIVLFDIAPDGKKLAFTDFNSTFTMNLDGTDLRPISRGDMHNNEHGGDASVYWVNDRLLKTERWFNVGNPDKESEAKMFLLKADGSYAVALEQICPPSSLSNPEPDD